MFGGMQIIYYIIRSIATKVDSTYLGYCPTAHNVYVCGKRWARTRDISITCPPLSLYTTHVRLFTLYILFKSIH